MFPCTCLHAGSRLTGSFADRVATTKRKQRAKKQQPSSERQGNTDEQPFDSIDEEDAALAAAVSSAGSVDMSNAAPASERSRSKTLQPNDTIDMADVAPDSDTAKSAAAQPYATIDMADVAPGSNPSQDAAFSSGGTIDMADVAPASELSANKAQKPYDTIDMADVAPSSDRSQESAPRPSDTVDTRDITPPSVARFSSKDVDQRAALRKRNAAERKRAATERDEALRADVQQRHKAYQEARQRKEDAAKGAVTEGEVQKELKKTKLAEQPSRHAQPETDAAEPDGDEPSAGNEGVAAQQPKLAAGDTDNSTAKAKSSSEKDGDCFL